MSTHWQEAERHLAGVDRKLAALMKKAGPCTISPSRESIFYSLASSIVYQQLAGSAAASILARVDALFDGGQCEPRQLLALEEARLRGAGLSQAKMLALKDLAAKTLDGTVPDGRRMRAMSDEEIIEHATRVRGIGRWTVEMLLLFRLRRPNVLPVDDYGVRKGMQLLYGMRELPTKQQMLRRGEKWAPWCSVASWYMWRVLEQPEFQRKRKTANAAAKKTLKKAAQKTNGRRAAGRKKTR